MDSLGGYVIKTCHDGTDWGVYDFDPERDEQDERYDSHEEVMQEAHDAAAHLNRGIREGVLPMRVFDFSTGGKQ